jgi:hypothetical protein
MKNKEDLLDLKEQIADAKTEISKKEGSRETLMSQLKEQYQCESIEDADGKVKKLDKQIGSLQIQIEEGTLELEKKLKLQKQDV